MKRTAIFLSCLVLSVALMAGCSDKTASSGSLSTNPELAGVTALSSSDATDMKTTTLILEAEEWDGVSPIEDNRFYHFKNIEEAKRALVNKPKIIEWYEKQLVNYDMAQERAVNQSDFSLEVFSKTVALEKARKILADKPDVLKQVEEILADADLSYHYVRTAEKQKPRKLMITMKESNSKLVTDERSTRKIKKDDTGPQLADAFWYYSDATCAQAIDQGTNGWVTYPSPVRMIVRTAGMIDWVYPATWEIMHYDIVGEGGSLYSWGATSGSDIGGIEMLPWCYTMANGLWISVSATIDLYDAGWNPVGWDADIETTTWAFVRKGDCDLNGTLNVFDILKIVKWIGGEETPTAGNQQHAGDLNDDGACNVYDLEALIDILNG